MTEDSNNLLRTNQFGLAHKYCKRNEIQKANPKLLLIIVCIYISIEYFI